MDKLNLDTMLRQLYGIDPYNNGSNILYGDAHLANYIKNNFSISEINSVKKKLGIFYKN